MSRFVFLLMLAVTCAGCNEVTVASRWLDGEIRIDGARADWSKSYYHFENEGLHLGVANDARFLYLMIATSDHHLSAQALGRGVQARFRPEAGEGQLWIGTTRAIGFGRPGGPPETSGRLEEFEDSEEPAIDDPFEEDSLDSSDDPFEDQDRPRGRRSGRMRGAVSEDRIRRGVQDVPEEVRFYDASGADSLRLSSSEAAGRGIEMRPGFDRDGYFLLEIKVPLMRDAAHPNAIGLAAAEGEVGLTLLIPKGERGEFGSKRRERPGMMQAPDDDILFPEGGRRGGFGRGPGAMNFSDGLELKVKLTLAPAP